MKSEAVPTEVIATIFAIVGGLAKYLHNYIQGKPFVFAVLFANLIVSGFSGFMFAQFAQVVGASEKVQFISAGIGGFMGAAAIDLIQTWLLDKFFISYQKKRK